MKLTEFFSILKSAVRHFPANEMPCKQLQTFKVFGIDRAVELNTDNAGATIQDKNKPYFYSRKWEREGYNPNSITFELPALGVTQLSTIKESKGGKSLKASYLMQLAVIDVVRDTAECAGGPDGLYDCAQRNVSEIFADCEAMMDTLIVFLMQVVKIRFETGQEAWYYRPAIESAHQRGFVPDYSEVAELAEYMQFDGRSARYDLVEVFTTSHYGVSVNIRLENIECVAGEINVPINEADVQTIGHEAGCLTCG